jgi:hypothetical protein
MENTIRRETNPILAVPVPIVLKPFKLEECEINTALPP